MINEEILENFKSHYKYLHILFPVDYDFKYLYGLCALAASNNCRVKSHLHIVVHKCVYANSFTHSYIGECISSQASFSRLSCSGAMCQSQIESVDEENTALCCSESRAKVGISLVYLDFCVFLA